MSGSVWWFVRRGAYLFRTEGFAGLLSGTGRHLTQLLRGLYWSEEFVIYATDTCGYGIGLSEPSVEGLEVYVIHTETDVLKLCAAGYEDVRCIVRPAGRRLSSGAVGFCAFVNRRVSHVAWVAFNATAKRGFDSLPYDIDFENGEAAWGGALTISRYRNLGLYRYVMAWRMRYCHERGCPVLVDSTSLLNVASLRSQATYNPEVRAVGHYRRFLRRSRWTQREPGISQAALYGTAQ